MSDSASERSVPSLAASLTRSRSWRYVARPDSETALCRMLALLRGGETQVALLGPPASGKTLLLHVLSERLGPGFPSAYLPNPALGPDQVRPWLETCGETIPADAGSALEDLAHAYARRGPGLVLLIDDADDMPHAVAEAFARTLERSDGHLRLVLAGADAARLDAVLARLGGRAERVEIGRSSDARESDSAEAPASRPGATSPRSDETWPDVAFTPPRVRFVRPKPPPASAPQTAPSPPAPATPPPTSRASSAPLPGLASVRSEPSPLPGLASLRSGARLSSASPGGATALPPSASSSPRARWGGSALRTDEPDAQADPATPEPASSADPVAPAAPDVRRVPPADAATPAAPEVRRVPPVEPAAVAAPEVRRVAPIEPATPPDPAVPAAPPRRAVPPRRTRSALQVRRPAVLAASVVLALAATLALARLVGFSGDAPDTDLPAVASAADDTLVAAAPAADPAPVAGGADVDPGLGAAAPAPDAAPDADPASRSPAPATEPERMETASAAARDDLAEAPRTATAETPDPAARPVPVTPDATAERLAGVAAGGAPSGEAARPLAVAAATTSATAAPPAAAAPEPVRVHVNARPWARISVDGEEIGVTPLGNVPLEPGVRRFRAELADGRVIEREVEIDGASRRVTFP